MLFTWYPKPKGVASRTLKSTGGLKRLPPQPKVLRFFVQRVFLLSSRGKATNKHCQKFSSSFWRWFFFTTSISLVRVGSRLVTLPLHLRQQILVLLLYRGRQFRVLHLFGLALPWPYDVFDKVPDRLPFCCGLSR